jgi:predicted enzyme related to lactoylglutathione lyase
MPEPTGLARLTSFKLVVSDLDRAAAFYRTICGFTQSREMRFSVGGRPFRDIILQNDPRDHELTLLAYDDGEAPDPGSVILTYTTDDLDTFRQKALAAGGAEITRERSLRLGQWHARIAEFADPDGNILQILQKIEAAGKQEWMP